MDKIEEGDLILSLDRRELIGIVLETRRANWGIWYNLFWENGSVTPHWNKFGCKPEIIKYETENPIRKLGFAGLLQRAE